MGIFLPWATWVHEYMAIFVNIDSSFKTPPRFACGGVLKELDVCSYDKTWSPCQTNDDSCCEKR